VSEAARLLEGRDGEVTAVVLDGQPQLADELAGYGADRIIRVVGMAWDGADIGIPAGAISDLAHEYPPRLVLVAGTTFGRDLGPRLAVRLGAGLVEDCTYLRLVAGGDLEGTRMEADGASASRVAWRNIGPDDLLARTAQVVGVDCPELGEPLVTLLDSRPIDPAELPLEDVSVIVAGGLGLGSPEGFDLLADLAEALGGKVAASRRATDLGWAGRDALVGQTGKTVEPALYFACGISGASQHVLGMKDSGFIVSVNKDSYAPMNAVADLAVTADALDLLPLLTAEFRRVASTGDAP
jgi:electron transfer flavoprotein alpha subunit